MSYAAALARADARPPKLVREVSVTIPEGFTRRADRGAARRPTACAATTSPPRARSAASIRRSTTARRASVHTLEGFLFPATYFDLPARRASAALVAQQLAAFQQNFDQLNFKHARAAGLTRYDVLIIASMIEREAQVAGRPRAGRGRHLQPPARRHRRSASTRRCATPCTTTRSR